MCNEEIASGCTLAMTERGVIASEQPYYVIASLQPHNVIASEQPHYVIASLITIRRSNPLKTLNTKRSVQRGDCFTPTHLPTLRFAMTEWSNRGDCFVASLLAMAGKEGLA
jgi:hypothetical protein